MAPIAVSHCDDMSFDDIDTAMTHDMALSCTLCLLHGSLTRCSDLFLRSAEPRFEDAQAPLEFLTVTDDNSTQVCMAMNTNTWKRASESTCTRTQARAQSDTIPSLTQATLSTALPRHSPPRLMLTLLLPPALGLLLLL